MITEEQKEVIIGASFGEIKLDQLLTKFPKDVSEKEFVLKLLEDAGGKRDAEELELVIILCLLLNSFSTYHSLVLCNLLMETWHYKHEDIVSVLHTLKDPNTADCLYKAAMLKLDYLSYDETYQLARKSIKVLGELKTEEAVTKLKSLSQSTVQMIRDYANKELLYLSQS